jgi:hypothetical protein
VKLIREIRSSLLVAIAAACVTASSSSTAFRRRDQVKVTNEHEFPSPRIVILVNTLI